MQDGKISILDGCGDDLGSFMRGGLIVVRGNCRLARGRRHEWGYNRR